MIGRFIRDTVNLLIYGGIFIGLCAACITALSFELIGRAPENFAYAILIGTATAALYTIHRIIGLNKTAHLKTSTRFVTIRKYQAHIRIYTVLWILISLWLFIPMFSLRLVAWLLPGGIIALTYVIPFLSGGRRLRDLGWGKIILIGWSWAWLTAFLPLYYFGEASIQTAILHSIERMLFIILLTIPFEIRDMQLDRSLSLITLPDKLGKPKTRTLMLLICFFIALFSFIPSIHYFNPPYGISMSLTSLLLIPMVNHSYSTDDDFYFAGLTDGMMIVVLWLFIGLRLIL